STCSSELAAQNSSRNFFERLLMRQLTKHLTKIRYQLTRDISTRIPNSDFPTTSLCEIKCSMPPPCAISAADVPAPAGVATPATAAPDGTAGAASPSCASTCIALSTRSNIRYVL